MLSGPVGLAIMAIATPTPQSEPPAEQQPRIEAVEEASRPIEIPAPPVALLFGLVAGALVIRRIIAR